MGAVIEFIIDSIREFGKEIVAGMLVVIALWMFPGLKRLFGRESDSEHEQRIQRELEVQRQKEEKLKEELRRAEIERELEAKQRAAGTVHQETRYRNDLIASVMVMIVALGFWWWVSSPDSSENQAATETQVSTSKNPTDPEAQNALGNKYYIAKDYELAMKWWHTAANNGYAEAQCNLGFMYVKGYGVNQDYKEAMKWYRKAAEQRQAEAQYNIGVMYEYGESVTKDFNEARKWYQLAADQGNELAQQALPSLN